MTTRRKPVQEAQELATVQCQRKEIGPPGTYSSNRNVHEVHRTLQPGRAVEDAEKAVVEGKVVPSEAVNAADKVLAEVNKAIPSGAPAQRMVLSPILEDEHSQSERAGRLGTTEGTVRQHLNHALSHVDFTPRRSFGEGMTDTGQASSGVGASAIAFALAVSAAEVHQERTDSLLRIRAHESIDRVCSRLISSFLPAMRPEISCP